MALRKFNDARPATTAALHEDHLLFITADRGTDQAVPSIACRDAAPSFASLTVGP
jgi:phosphopentomutase